MKPYLKKLKVFFTTIFINTFIVTLSNGYEGYIATQKAFKNGGYEVKPAFSSKLSEDTGKILIDQYIKMFKLL